MNMFLIFLLIFFGIVGVVQTVNFLYAFMLRFINNFIYRKDEDDIKIWMKL